MYTRVTECPCSQIPRNRRRRKETGDRGREGGGRESSMCLVLGVLQRMPHNTNGGQSTTLLPLWALRIELKLAAVRGTLSYPLSHLASFLCQFLPRTCLCAQLCDNPVDDQTDAEVHVCAGGHAGSRACQQRGRQSDIFTQDLERHNFSME